MARKRRLLSKLQVYLFIIIITMMLLTQWTYYNKNIQSEQSHIISTIIINKTENIDTDLLIIIIDNRVNFSHESYAKMPHNEIEYYMLSMLINLLYAKHWKYSIIFVQPIQKNNKYCTVMKENRIKKWINFNWCKLYVLKYYLSDIYTIISYKWILYLDSDAILSQFHVSLDAFLNSIFNNINKRIINDINMIIGTDIPLWAQTQINIITESNLICSNLVTNDTSMIVNAGSILLKRNNISELIIDTWAKTWDKCFFYQQNWPAEQGMLNCFIMTNMSLNNSILRLPYGYGIKVGKYSKKKDSYILHVPGYYYWGRNKYFTQYLQKIIQDFNRTDRMKSILYFMGNLSTRSVKHKNISVFQFIEYSYHFWKQ
eukprot:243303_1